MSQYPAATTGLGVAAKIAVAGNINPANTTPGYNNVFLSLAGTDGPTTFQLEPNLEDIAGNEITPGTPLVLTAVAASSIGVLTLSAAAAAANGVTVYTGTITGGGSNAFAGDTFTIAGFDNAANNGVFIATASTTTTLTLENAFGVADTHAATATPEQGTAVYTGTITGGGSNALAGQTFVVAGFTGANNNGTFIATASSTSTLTLANDIATAETHAATATSQEVTNALTYVAYGARNVSTGSPNGAVVATVSATGLITAVTAGSTTVEVSYPTFNNTVGNVASSGNIMNGLPINKVYAEVNVTVGP
jgi:trimeric autotransporter adhesin